ncbi:hypothetical protein Leryth_012554 [Lithospermum erythrorhizon]|nr:hypothetical protein Leryth_012554 [Lithospermum erythrorhizon]
MMISLARCAKGCTAGTPNRCTKRSLNNRPFGTKSRVQALAYDTILNNLESPRNRDQYATHTKKTLNGHGHRCCRNRILKCLRLKTSNLNFIALDKSSEKPESTI